MPFSCIIAGNTTKTLHGRNYDYSHFRLEESVLPVLPKIISLQEAHTPHSGKPGFRWTLSQRLKFDLAHPVSPEPSTLDNATPLSDE